MSDAKQNLRLIQGYIQSLEPMQQVILTRHIIEFTKVIDDSPDAHLAYVALSLMGAERLVELSEGMQDAK